MIRIASAIIFACLFHTGLAQANHNEAILAPAPAFTGIYSAVPVAVRVGNPVSLSASITATSGNLSKGIVALEIYNSSNQIAFQKYFTKQNFQTGAVRSYAATWVPIIGGVYTYRVRVLNSNWSKVYLSTTASTITVCGASK